MRAGSFLLGRWEAELVKYGWREASAFGFARGLREAPGAVTD